MARTSVKNKIVEKWTDEDGAWIALKSGWQDVYNPTCHTIHEDTMAECMSIAKDAVPCRCKDCVEDLARIAAGLKSTY